jgi:hypothetical protein
VDATNDLLLGVFANVDMSWIEAYMVSSQRCGFRGRKILLVWNLHPTVRAKLTEYGFELVDVPQGIPGGDWHVSHKNFYEYRDVLAYEFLRDRGHEFRYVFWMDIRDLIFQSDPSVWMEKNLDDKKLVIATESYYIKNEACNDNWIKNIFPADYTRLREHEALNGGTFAGTPEVLAEVFKRTVAIAKATHEIAEQAALNYIAREKDFESITLVPRVSEGFAIVGYAFGNLPNHFWLDPGPELRKGILYPKGSNEPSCIVHQYDRNRDWKYPVGDCYRIGPIPKRSRYAADGLTIDWWDGPGR